MKLLIVAFSDNGLRGRGDTYIPSIPGRLIHAGADADPLLDDVGAGHQGHGQLGEVVQLRGVVRLQLRGSEPLATYWTAIEPCH